MTISTLDGFLAATKQRISLYKTAARTAGASIPFSVYGVAGNPGAGTLAGTNTVAGVVPDDTTAEHPRILPFGSGATGYLTRIEAASSVACRIAIYDLLWKGGAYAYNASVALSGQPSFAARLPNGDYSNLELWLEQVTAATGIQSVAVTYTNQDGVTGKSTGTISQGTAGIVGRMTMLPLAAGDKGVQAVTNVVGTVATAGTFNILVMRPLGEVRIRVANDGVVQDILQTGAPIVFDTSALMLMVTPDAASTGLPDVQVDISNG